MAVPAPAALIDCMFQSTSEAVKTVKVTVCLKGARKAENEIAVIEEAEIQLENVGPDRIELQTYPELRDVFDAVIGGEEGLITKKKEPRPPADSVQARTPQTWRYVSLRPGESHHAKVAIGELLAQPPAPGRLYRVSITPRFTFVVPGKDGSHYETYRRMMSDAAYKYSVMFRDVRLR